MRFIAGDELGNLKVLRTVETGQKLELKQAITSSRLRAVQKLATKPLGNIAETTLVSAAYADGTITTFSCNRDDSFEKINTWNEPRMKASDCYVGLSASKQGVFSCTSNGALRLESGERGSETASTARLPTRLCDWRLSPSTQKFAYGGDEVDLSIWDVEKAFTTPVANTQLLSDTSSSKKRKRSDALLPAEIWRAKNVPNDSLGLRQPVRITSIAYVTSSECHLLVGTQLGDLRRYDIRAARRPISDWKNIGKTGGIRALESGHTENQAFVSDGASNLFAMDLRTGRVIYAYKGISGAVTSIAPSTSVMVTTSQDRFVRLHSVFPPPSQVSQQQDAKGQVVDKMFMKASPTVISWDQCPDLPFADTRDRADFQEDEDMWEDMEEIGDNERDNRKK